MTLRQHGSQAGDEAIVGQVSQTHEIRHKTPRVIGWDVCTIREQAIWLLTVLFEQVSYRDVACFRENRPAIKKGLPKKAFSQTEDAGN